MNISNRNDILTFIASHISADNLTQTKLVIIEHSHENEPCDIYVQIVGCESVEAITHHGYGNKFNFTFSEVVNEQHEIRWDSTNKVWYNNKK